MLKLKKLINENTPGFMSRRFGDPLPTLSDIMDNHQSVVKEVSFTDMGNTKLETLLSNYGGDIEEKAGKYEIKFKNGTMTNMALSLIMKASKGRFFGLIASKKGELILVFKK